MTWRLDPNDPRNPYSSPSPSPKKDDRPTPNPHVSSPTKDDRPTPNPHPPSSPKKDDKPTPNPHPPLPKDDEPTTHGYDDAPIKYLQNKDSSEKTTHTSSGSTSTKTTKISLPGNSDGSSGSYEGKWITRPVRNRWHMMFSTVA